MANRKMDVKRIKYTFTESTTEHRWKFGGNVPDVVFVQADAPESTRARAERMGYKQSIANSWALSQGATDAEKYEAGMARIARIMDGDWDGARGGSRVDVAVLTGVIAAITGKSLVGIKTWLDSKDDDGLRTIAKSEQFGEAYRLQMSKRAPVTKLSDDDAAELEALE